MHTSGGVGLALVLQTKCHEHSLTCRAISLMRVARCSPPIKMAVLSWFLHTRDAPHDVYCARQL